MRRLPQLPPLLSTAVAVALTAGAVVPASATPAAPPTVSISSDRAGHVYRPGEDASLVVTTNARRVDWKLFNIDARVVEQATSVVDDGAARIRIPRQGNGQYRLALDAEGATLSSGFAWIPETATDTAFGLAGHWVDAGGQSNWDPITTEAVQSIGVGTVRTDVQWSAVERSQGVFDFSLIDARIAAIEPNVSSVIVPLTYGNRFYTATNLSAPLTDAARRAYAVYARTTIAHLEQRFPDLDFAFEVYNEWPRSIPDSVDQYIALLREVERAVDPLRPRSPLVGGVQTLNSSGEHDWWREFLQNGGADTVQALSVHPYQFQETSANPDICQPLAPQSCTEYALRWLQGQIEQYASAPTPLWVTENGWWSLTGQPGTVAPGMQAAYLARGWAVAAAAGVQRYVVYEALNEVPKATFTQSDHFGVFGDESSDWGSRNGAVAYATLIRQTSGLEFVSDRSAAGIRELLFSDGTVKVRMLWSAKNDPVTGTISLGGTGTRVDLYGVERAVAGTGGKLTVTVGSAPVFLVEGR